MTNTNEIAIEVRIHGGVRTLNLCGDGLTLTQAMARQLDRIECYDAPLTGGCIEPIGRVRTGIKVQVQRKLPDHPGTVTARHTQEADGWEGHGDWYEDIETDPYLEVIGRDPDTGDLVIWECDQLGEYLKYHDDAGERGAVMSASSTLPLIVLP